MKYCFLILIHIGCYLLADSGGAINPYAEPRESGRGGFSSEERKQKDTCYLKLLPSSESEHASCSGIKYEQLCKEKGICRWRSGGGKCIGVGLAQCQDVLRSQCEFIQKLPEGDLASPLSRKYLCDPLAKGSILKSI